VAKVNWQWPHRTPCRVVGLGTPSNVPTKLHPKQDVDPSRRFCAFVRHLLTKDKLMALCSIF